MPKLSLLAYLAISSYRCFACCETPVFNQSSSNTVYSENYAKEEICKIPSLQNFYPGTFLFISKSAVAVLWNHKTFSQNATYSYVICKHFSHLCK